MTAPLPSPALLVHDTEAGILGSMMIDNRIITSVSERLRPEHFGDDLHRRIYQVMLKLHAAGEQATPVTLKPYFPAGSAVDDKGAEFSVPGYMASMTGSGAGLIGTQTFADQIIQFAHYRQAREVLRAGIEKIEAVVKPIHFWEDPTFPDLIEVTADTSAAMQKIVEGRNPHKIVGMGDLLKRVRARHDRARSGIATGATCATIPDLTEIIGPAAPGQLTILGGRSGMGKTVLACSAAWGFAINGHPTQLISLEMTNDALAMRMAADLTFGMNEPVLFADMVRDRLDETMLLQIDEASRRIDLHPLRTVAPGRVTIEQIDTIVAREVARLGRLGKKLEVVVLDYVQIVAATGKLDGTQRMNHISEGLLGIAQRYELHVIALSQLLREIDKRPDRRPTTADLKESGRLEEDADNVLLVYRPEFYLAKERPDPKDEAKYADWEIEIGKARGRADLIGAKVRMGEQQTKSLRFFGKHQAMRGSDFVEPTWKDDGVLLTADGSAPSTMGIDGGGFGLP